MSELHHAVGRHDEAIDRLQRDVGEMRDSLKRIESTLSETKGGIRVLIGVGALSGAVGASIVKAIAFLKGA